MVNSELWKLTEDGKVKKGDVFSDKEGNEIIFTGKSFQVYFTEQDDRYYYVGMCLEDEWTFSHNDLRELELQAKESK